jgi:hypothetical protein
MVYLGFFFSLQKSEYDAAEVSPGSSNFTVPVFVKITSSTAQHSTAQHSTAQHNIASTIKLLPIDRLKAQTWRRYIL